jgi:hypothetical protein
MMKIRYVQMEMQSPIGKVAHSNFLSLRIYACRHKGCPFKLLSAILCGISATSDEVVNKITGVDRFLCYIAHRGDHKIIQRRCFNAHCMGLGNPLINWDHNPFRTNLSID